MRLRRFTKERRECDEFDVLSFAACGEGGGAAVGRSGALRDGSEGCLKIETGVVGDDGWDWVEKIDVKGRLDCSIGRRNCGIPEYLEDKEREERRGCSP